MVTLTQYGDPMSQTLEKRSSNCGNAGLSPGETAGLVVGIIGVVLTALTVLKGWKCWQSRKNQAAATTTQSHTPLPAPAVTNHFHIYPPTLAHPAQITTDIPLSFIDSPAPPAPSSPFSTATSPQTNQISMNATAPTPAEG
ncbi:hypothetical protein K440DRAFT_679127 [Wilcoxina mikolae CBS 423.85]|nr:hypothetical protein K440DRAFT_679127 [Wilcoxina mikolae CBS 423.85]